jgi:23S rRNA (cytidine1920-2'-O)/16S rRNA (cytidine1409-2'-O)-methyltransferase
VEKTRLDILLVEHGLVDSRSLAERLVMAGQVRVDGQVLLKPSIRVANTADLTVDHGPQFVSRGGEKLASALEAFGMRNDPRVSVMEQTNARTVIGFPQAVDLVTVDASFISLRILLPVIHSWFKEGAGQVVALIKPQFEAGRADAARGQGVIRDPEIHRQVLHTVLEAARIVGFGVQGLIRSPLLGPKGNVEFLVYLKIPSGANLSIADLVNQVVISP